MIDDLACDMRKLICSSTEDLGMISSSQARGVSSDDWDNVKETDHVEADRILLRTIENLCEIMNLDGEYSDLLSAFHRVKKLGLRTNSLKTCLSSD